jgi:UDP-N-acetylmuramoyl-tripeptide--D-alanyl-D-alanine ligase
MEPRSLQYIVDATGGELLHGSSEKIVARISTDSRQVQPGDLFVALAGERFDAHAFLPEIARRGAGAVVAEKKKLPAGFSACPVVAVERTRVALGRLAACYRRDFDLPVLAVCGSNGKTTTKEMIASVLRQAKATLWSEASFNNDVGVPLTLLRLEKSHQAAVLEAGTNHPGELAPLITMMQPRLGVLTNIGREHLEFFGTLDGVAREEGAVAELLPGSGTLFVNGDDEWTRPVLRRARARVVRVGLAEGNDFIANAIQCDATGATFRVVSPGGRLDGQYRINLLGRHQVVNALLALAVGAQFQLTLQDIQRGLAACSPAKMRLQLWSGGGVQVLDDAYNANADSMLAALLTLRELPCAGRRVAVLGDMAELGDGSAAAHAEVGRRAAELGIDHLFAVGRNARDIAASARQGGLRNVIEISEVEAATQAVKDFARPGDAILIKASRAMRLERISEQLRKAIEPSTANPAAARNGH